MAICETEKRGEWHKNSRHLYQLWSLSPPPSLPLSLSPLCFFQISSTSFPVSSCIVCFAVHCILCFIFWLRTIPNGNPGIRTTKSLQLLFHLLLIPIRARTHFTRPPSCNCRTRSAREINELYFILFVPVFSNWKPRSGSSGGVAHFLSFDIFRAHGIIALTMIISVRCSVFLRAA